jgi:hypothetical protein
LKDVFFWHLPLEFHGAEESEIVKVLVGETRRLILNSSRIFQRRGLILWSFRCQVQEGNKWNRVGGTVACLRLNAKVPPSNIKLRQYSSGPLAQQV